VLVVDFVVSFSYTLFPRRPRAAASDAADNR
jgi:hypothetical protein